MRRKRGANNVSTRRPIYPYSTRYQVVRQIVITPIFRYIRTLTSHTILREKGPGALRQFATVYLFVSGTRGRLALTPNIANVCRLHRVNTVRRLLWSKGLLFLTKNRHVFPILERGQRVFMSPLFRALIVTTYINRARRVSGTPKRRRPITLCMTIFLLLYPGDAHGNLYGEKLFASGRGARSLSSYSSTYANALPSTPWSPWLSISSSSSSSGSGSSDSILPLMSTFNLQGLGCRATTPPPGTDVGAVTEVPPALLFFNSSINSINSKSRKTTSFPTRSLVLILRVKRTMLALPTLRFSIRLRMVKLFPPSSSGGTGESTSSAKLEG